MALDASPLALQIRQLLGGPLFPEAGPHHILVMLVLISYGRDGKEMRPSGMTLAAETCLSRRQLSRITGQLEAWGFIVGKRDGRKPVVWELGPVLTGEPEKDHPKALRAKAEILAKKENEKVETNPEKTAARSLKSFRKHCPESLERYDDGLDATIIVLPKEAVGIAQEILDDQREAFPEEWRVGPADVIAAKPMYASFAAAHTRDEEDKC